MQSNQEARTVCLVRPGHFAFNSETAPSNIFQKKGDAAGAAAAALAETDALASALEGIGMDCIVIEDRKTPIAPDAVFPNNWFSTHADGTVVLYPLLSPLRRAERRMDIFESILPERGFDVRRILDFTSFEARNRFVEGTGSLVFDHLHSTAYVNLSARTDQSLANEICRQLGYETVFFRGESAGNEIYHTNVVLSIGSHVAVICEECITDALQRKEVCRRLTSTGRDLLTISLSQMQQFAGNMLQVRNRAGEVVTVLSEAAMASLLPDQQALLKKRSRLLCVPIPVIEGIGGGSVRCMMAEIFLPAK